MNEKQNSKKLSLREVKLLEKFDILPSNETTSGTDLRGLSAPGFLCLIG